MKDYIAVEKDQLTHKDMEIVLAHIDRLKLYDYAIIGAIANNIEIIVNVVFKRKKTDEYFSYRAIKIIKKSFPSLSIRKQELYSELLCIANGNASLVDEALEWAYNKDTIPDLDEIKEYIIKTK